MKDTYVVKRLETMLRVWEQTLFVANAETRLAQPDACRGAIKNWHRFRKAIIDRAHELDLKEFEIPVNQFYSYFVEVVSYDFLPRILAKWSRSSRRVYSLSEDTQRDLELTSVAGVTWNDLHAPFPCFIISLPLPIPGIFNNMVDTLSVEVSNGYICIMAMGNELDSFKPMPREVKNRIASASHHGNVNKLVLRTQAARKAGYCYIPSSQYAEIACNRFDREIVPDSLGVENVEFQTITKTPTDEEKERTLRFWLPIYRIAIGLCLRLGNQDTNAETAPAGDGTGKPHTLTEDSHAITSTKNLTLITCEHFLTDDERRIHGVIRDKGSLEALRELKAHFRSAYWRRPPGKGDDPTAPKSVRVRWTIVNEDRLPEHALPAGTLVQVK